MPSPSSNQHDAARSDGLQRPPAISWSGLVKGGATAIAASAAALNLIGNVAHAYWVRHWGFHEGQFPLDANDRVTLGYVALFDRLVVLLTAWTGELAILFIAVAGCVAVFLTAHKAAATSTNRIERLGNWLQRVPWWTKELVKGLGISGLAVIWLYAVLVVACSALLLAPLIGESFSKDWIERTEAQIAGGCNQASLTSGCTAFTQSDKTSGLGFIVVASTSHVVIYDVEGKRTHLVPTEGTKLSGRNRQAKGEITSVKK